jgi:pimeloyl-ACP methyl ester carboxylesterase
LRGAVKIPMVRRIRSTGNIAAMVEAYRPRKPSRSRTIDVRGLRTFVREWGPEGAPPLVMMHGSRDCSATFQFLVDEMKSEFHIFAPDHRGYGNTQWNAQGYWFHDYLVDLEVILDTLVPNRALPLIGHSLGGQIVSTFAAIRPARVTRLISLDAFGLVDENPEKTPDLIRRWMDAWRDGPEPSRAYDSVEELATRLRQTNERLTMDKALFLAAESSRRTPDGKLEWSFDPHHRTPFPIPHRKSEWAANVKRIEAPTLWLASGRVSRIDKEEPGGIAARAALLNNVVVEKVADTSHNLHHDKPADVARIVEAFLARG